MQATKRMALGLFLVLLTLASALAAPPMTADECRRRAAAGEAEAQWQLGQRYEAGEGVKQDAMRAIAQYKKAADQGHREACAKLASYYDSGTLVGKNPTLAAKYRALANGEDPDTAIADAKAATKAKRYDEVEVAIDYIVGRNGKEKDPKTGIRLLYSSAKNNPDAQRVFCQAWDQDALDLSALDDAEWELVIPWFRNAYDDGMRSCGLVLGNDAYHRGRYQAAIQYWTAAGNAGVGKAWLHLGRFFLPANDDGDFHAPKNLRNEQRAKDAFERASRLNWDGKEDALFMVGMVCLYGDDVKCIDYKRAFEIFSFFLKKEPNNQIFLFEYGWAGIFNSTGSEFDRLEQIDRRLRGQSLSSSERRELKRQEADIKQRIGRTVRGYMRYIKQSADMGYEPAQKDYAKLDSMF